jgi:hypothetical protein
MDLILIRVGDFIREDAGRQATSRRLVVWAEVRDRKDIVRRNAG